MPEDKTSSRSKPEVVGSASLVLDNYWWFTVRASLLEKVFKVHVPEGAQVLDVGSSDAPSNQWMNGHCEKTAMDLDPRGLNLEAGDVVGSVTDIPFPDAHFDVVSAFDVIEHIPDEKLALDEIFRVLKPGGKFLMAVPAYEWAWSSHDEIHDHQRRYNRRRGIRALERSGFTVERSTYGFTGVFPFFTAERLARRVSERGGSKRGWDEHDLPELPQPSAWQEKLLYGASKLDEKLIGKRNLPFGSSLFLVARKPE